MPYAVRVRLYSSSEMDPATLEADTDPDLDDDATGSEVVPDLAAAQAALVELCGAFHGPEVRLLGFGPIPMDSRLAWLQELRRGGETLDSSYGYIVLLATPQLRIATWWRAQVDIRLLP